MHSTLTAAIPATARLNPTQVDEAAREYLHGWDTPDPVQATATHGLSPVDAECLAEAYGPRDGRRVGRALVALCRRRSAKSAAARALRAIPSEVRSEQSRSNGRRGGRPPETVHVTRVTAAGETYGHANRHCDPAGCAGHEYYFGLVEGAQRGHVYEIRAGRIVAEIVE